MSVKPEHYNKLIWTRILSDLEASRGFVELKIDPYRLARQFKMGGGAREQIFKKTIRWTDKGHSEEKVIKEIIQACERHLEIIKEDSIC